MNDDSCPCNQPLTSHPQWCDPRACHTTDEGIEHRSTLVTRNLRTSVWQFQHVRFDEYAHSGPGGVELIVTIEADDDPAFDVVIPVDDIGAVRAALDVEFYRQSFLAAPVERESRVAA